MQFLHPGYLWFLSLISIPILIHLFSFRRYKTLQFSSTRFLQQLQQESDQRNKIKHWLVLLTRIFTIIALVLAFAQPYIPYTQGASDLRSVVSVYVDNTFSMRNTHNGVANFELARRKAIEIIKAQKETTPIQILSAACAGHEQRLLDKKEALQYVEELAIVAASPNWHLILQKQKDLLQTCNAANAYCYYLSDFQDPTVPTDVLKADTNTHLIAIPFIANSKANIVVDSCWLAQPIQMQDQASQLLVRLKNYGETAAGNVRISMSLNKQQKYVGAVNIPANASIIDTIPVSVHDKGLTQGLIHVNDEPINFDNDFYFTLNVKSSFQVYCLSANAKNSAFQALSAGFKNANFVFGDFAHVNYNALEQSDVLLLSDIDLVNGGLEAAIEKRQTGKALSIILFPAEKQADGLNNFLSKYAIHLGASFAPGPLKGIEGQDPFFKDMFRKVDESMEMPFVNKAYQLSVVGQGDVYCRSLLRSKSEAALLLAIQKQHISLFVFGFSLLSENTNFSRKALFAPMLAKMLLASNENSPLAYDLGKISAIEVPFSANTKEAAFHLVSATQDIIPEQRIVENSLFINIHNQLQEPGCYVLGDGENKQLLAFNYSRNESRTVLPQQADNWAKTMHAKLLNADLANTGIMATAIQEGIHYWQWLILLALVFLLLEILLLRYFR